MTESTATTFDEFEVRLALIHACDEYGSQRAFARAHDFHECDIGKMIRGQARLSRKVLAVLGYEKVTRYIRRPAITGGESPSNAVGLVP